VPPFEIDGRSVRSSDIRSAIASGDLATAEDMLGRPYSVVGELAADGALRFAMPVASPPPGAYRVSVKQRPGTVRVDDARAMRLEAQAVASPGERLLVEFAAG
jgi:FAD synthase